MPKAPPRPRPLQITGSARQAGPAPVVMPLAPTPKPVTGPPDPSSFVVNEEQQRGGARATDAQVVYPRQVTSDDF
eukprot:5042234-Karenia_brevis.AAC.1